MIIIPYYYIAIAYQRHMSNEIQRMRQLTQENLAYWVLNIMCKINVDSPDSMSKSTEGVVEASET